MDETVAKRRARYLAFLDSYDWLMIRNRIMKRDGYRCFVCGGMASQAHHLIRERLYSERLDDLEAVCWRCHGDLYRGNGWWFQWKQGPTPFGIGPCD